MASNLTEGIGREYLLVLVSVVAMLVTASPVTRMAVEAWTERGVVYNATYAAVEAFVGVDIDLAVVVPSGIVLGWLLLFGLDRRKRLQGLIVVVFAILFVRNLLLLGRWAETVAWGRHAGALVAAVAIGIATGLYDRDWNGPIDSEFRSAARWLYRTGAAVTVIAFLEAHLAYDSPIVVDGGSVALVAIGPVDVVSAGLLVDLLATGAFVVVLGAFVTYSNQHDVLVVVPDDSTEVDFFGTFYHALVDPPQNARPVEPPRGNIEDDPAKYLNRARAKRSRDSLGEAVQYRPNGPVRLRYESGGPLNRQTMLTAGGVDVNDIHPGLFHRLERRVGEDGARLPALLRRARGLRSLVPDRARRVVRSREQETADRIDAVDTLVLVSPLSAALELDREGIEALDPDTAKRFVDYCHSPGFVSKYERLYEIYESDAAVDVVLVATDAGMARELYEVTEGDSPDLLDRRFRIAVASALGLDDVDRDDLYPVVSTGSRDRGEGVLEVIERF